MKKCALLIWSAIAILVLTNMSLALAAAPVASAPATVSAAAAVPIKPPSDPDPAANHILAEFMKTGVKVYYLGAQLGFNGWFLAKDNQVQIVYTTLDNQNAIVGVLFNANGDDVTTQQVKTLYNSNKDVNAYLTSLNGQQPGMGTAASLPGASPAATVAPSIVNSSLLPPSSPGERLMQALQETAGVNVGAPMAPKIFMVVDPYCPYCHETWRALRQDIFVGKLQVRLVPIDAVSPDSERASAQFLRSADPLNAWDKYIAGDESQLAGVPDATSLGAVHNNHALIDAWHINKTPFIVYRARDGQVKIIQGKPEQATDIIKDIAP